MLGITGIQWKTEPILTDISLLIYLFVLLPDTLKWQSIYFCDSWNQKTYDKIIYFIYLFYFSTCDSISIKKEALQPQILGYISKSHLNLD